MRRTAFDTSGPRSLPTVTFRLHIKMSSKRPRATPQPYWIAQQQRNGSASGSASPDSDELVGNHASNSRKSRLDNAFREPESPAPAPTTSQRKLKRHRNTEEEDDEEEQPDSPVSASASAPPALAPAAPANKKLKKMVSAPPAASTTPAKKNNSHNVATPSAHEVVPETPTSAARVSFGPVTKRTIFDAREEEEDDLVGYRAGGMVGSDGVDEQEVGFGRQDGRQLRPFLTDHSPSNPQDEPAPPPQRPQQQQQQRKPSPPLRSPPPQQQLPPKEPPAKQTPGKPKPPPLKTTRTEQQPTPNPSASPAPQPQPQPQPQTVEQINIPGFPAHLQAVTSLLTEREDFYKKQLSYLHSQLSESRSSLEESRKTATSWEKRAREALGGLEKAVKKAERLEGELKKVKEELEGERKKGEDEKNKMLERVRRAVLLEVEEAAR